MIQVVIVDHHPVVPAGFQVAGEAENIPEAEALVKELKPDLAIMDVLLPDINGLEGTPRLEALYPSLRAILVSAYRERNFRDSAKAAGVEAFFAKDELDLNKAQVWQQAYSNDAPNS
jgi:DNA-binding NarL/FixJ family response regulator